VVIHRACPPGVKTWLTPFRWLRLAMICLSVVACWYAFSYQRDWFLFHAWQDRAARDLAAFERALSATGAPLGPAAEFSSNGSKLRW
jgi:hypothetical protein